MHNTFKDLIVMILNVLIQFVLVIILVKSEIPTAMALALLVVGCMIYYIHHAAQDFIAPEDEDEQPEGTSKKSEDEVIADVEEPEVDDDEFCADVAAQKVAYQRYADGEVHSISQGICGTVTAGYGRLTTNGYWQYPLEVNQDAPFNILPQPLSK